MIEFRETKTDLIKTDKGGDFPASGRFWIDPETGAVLMSELVMENADLTATIDVSYQSEPVLGLPRADRNARALPRRSDERVEGTATYARFRQFQVKTGETIVKPPRCPGHGAVRWFSTPGPQRSGAW